MAYQPKPIRTDSVQLEERLLLLTERLAENNHDVWAIGRIEQGWSHGETRNDEIKTHPCLIPYAALPEREKDVDRKTVIETLKAIVALGYRIVAP